MKEKMFKNLSLKILSAIFAVVLWTVIVNVYDPTTSYTFSNVSVQLINTESLTDKNYSYEIVEGGKISVYVSGPKSIVTNIKASDIVATADLSKISAFADYVDIHVSVVKDGQVLNNVEATPKTSVRLSIENRDTKTVNVVSEITGSAADGYAVVRRVLNPTSVKVTGPSSVIDNIDHAGISFDVTGATADVTGTADIHLYDSDNNEINDSSVELTQTSVGYTAQVVRTKTVSIEVKTSGKPADGYRVSGVTLNRDSVVVYGDTNMLNSLDKIVIPASNINVDGLTENKVYKFGLSDYIDKSLTILDNARIEVTVRIESTGNKTITLNTSDIKVSGLETGMSYSFEDRTFSIDVEGSETAIAALDASAITMTADLSTYTTSGIQSITLSVKLPDGVTLKRAASVNVLFKDNTQETETTQSTQETTSVTTGN
mgnify:CR=1 FL=1